MSILKRARDRLPQEYLANGGIVKPSYRQDGGILSRYDRTPTKHSTGYSYDTIKYHHRPWDIGDFVTQPLGTVDPTGEVPPQYTYQPPVVEDIVDTSVTDDGGSDLIQTPIIEDPVVDPNIISTVPEEDLTGLPGQDNQYVNPDINYDDAYVADNNQIVGVLDPSEENLETASDWVDPSFYTDPENPIHSASDFELGSSTEGTDYVTDYSTDEDNETDIFVNDSGSTVDIGYGVGEVDPGLADAAGYTSPGIDTTEPVFVDDTTSEIPYIPPTHIETPTTEIPDDYIDPALLDAVAEAEDILTDIPEDYIDPGLAEAAGIDDDEDPFAGVTTYDPAAVQEATDYIQEGYEEAAFGTPVQAETTSETAASQGGDAPVVTSDTKALIEEREGFSSTAYEDPPGSGKWSIGGGTQTYADGTPVKQGDTITEAEADALTDYHIGVAEAAAINNVDNFSELSPELQTALTSHAYQLGEAGQAGFEKMIAAIEAGDWDTAIAEAEDSLWAQQTPKRLADLKAALQAEKDANTPATTPELEWITRADGLEKAYGPNGWIYRFNGEEFNDINDASAAQKYSQLTPEEQADVGKYGIAITSTTNLNNVRDEIADLKAEEEVFSQPVEVAETTPSGILADTGGYDEAPVTATSSGILADTGGYDEAPVVADPITAPEEEYNPHLEVSLAYPDEVHSWGGGSSIYYNGKQYDTIEAANAQKDIDDYVVPEWETAGYSTKAAYTKANAIQANIGSDEIKNIAGSYYYDGTQYDSYKAGYAAKEIANADPTEVTWLYNDGDGDGNTDYAYGGQVYNNRDEAETAENIAEDNIRDQEFEEYFPGSDVNSKTGYNDAGERVSIYEVGGEEYDNYSDANDAATDIQNTKDIQANVGSGEIDTIAGDYYYDGKKYDNYSAASTAKSGGYDEAPVVTEPVVTPASTTGGYDEAPVVAETTPDWEAAGYPSEFHYNYGFENQDWEATDHAGVNSKGGYLPDGSYQLIYATEDGVVYDSAVDALVKRNPTGYLADDGSVVPTTTSSGDPKFININTGGSSDDGPSAAAIAAANVSSPNTQVQSDYSGPSHGYDEAPTTYTAPSSYSYSAPTSYDFGSAYNYAGGGIIKRANQGGIQQSPYRGILMNKLNRRKR